MESAAETTASFGVDARVLAERRYHRRLAVTLVLVEVAWLCSVGYLLSYLVG